MTKLSQITLFQRLNIAQFPVKVKYFIRMRVKPRHSWRGYERELHSSSYVLVWNSLLTQRERRLACGETVQSDRSMKQEPTEGRALPQREPVGIPVL